MFTYTKYLPKKRKEPQSGSFRYAVKITDRKLTNDTGSFDTLYKSLLSEEEYDEQRKNYKDTAGVENG